MELEEFKLFLGENVATQNRDEANKAYRYFVRDGNLQKTYNYIRSKVKGCVLTGRGNLLSPVVYILDEPDQQVEDFLEDTFEKLNLKNYELYFTYLEKISLNVTSKDKINAMILDKELSIISPELVIAITDKELNIDCNIIKKSELKEFLNIREDKEKEDIIKKLRSKIWAIIKVTSKYYKEL